MSYGSGPVLDEVSLRIRAGETVAVVGHTGSGKSTLVGLVPRLMDPSSGAVLLDGIDLRKFDPAELRRQIGFVPQETFLFSATVGENIAFAWRTLPKNRSATRPRSPGWRAISKAFLRGTRPSWASAVSLSPAARSSVRRSPALFCATANSDSRRRVIECRYAHRRTHPDAFGGSDARAHGDPDLAPRFHRPPGGSHRGAGERRIVEQGTHSELIGEWRVYAELSQKQMLEEELEAI